MSKISAFMIVILAAVAGCGQQKPNPWANRKPTRISDPVPPPPGPAERRCLSCSGTGTVVCRTCSGQGRTDLSGYVNTYNESPADRAARREREKCGPCGATGHRRCADYYGRG